MSKKREGKGPTKPNTPSPSASSADPHRPAGAVVPPTPSTARAPGPQAVRADRTGPPPSPEHRPFDDESVRDDESDDSLPADEDPEEEV